MIKNGFSKLALQRLGTTLKFMWQFCNIFKIANIFKVVNTFKHSSKLQFLIEQNKKKSNQNLP